MNSNKVVEVMMNGTSVGRIALTPENVCAFEYNTDYLRTGVSVSPYFLPLKAGLMLAKPHPFAGGFGVFDDSLPDGWGRLLLDRFLQEQGIDPYQLNPLDRLSLAGTAGRGALEYYPDQSYKLNNTLLPFNQIAAEAEKILNTNYTGESLETLYQYGGSSGGARPKVFAIMGGKEWLVKFKANNDPVDVGETEYRYSLLAKSCGISMPETKLFEDRYFGVARFDRTHLGKVHTISAAALLNADYRIPSLDYATLLKVCLQLTRDMEQVQALFRLMVFNVVIANRDDHAKNFSFQLIDNQWKLSPAYDILPSNGFNGNHTTTINGKGLPTLADVLAITNEVNISNREAKLIVDEISTRCHEQNMAKYILK